MTKKIVMIEALSQYRMRYVFEVEDDIDHALDEYVMIESTTDLKEFSQLHLEPTVILSHREITKEDYLRIFDEDNEYLAKWDDEKKMTFINVLDYTKEPPLSSFHGEEAEDDRIAMHHKISQEDKDKLIEEYYKNYK
jgi:hypothetical protein